MYPIFPGRWIRVADIRVDTSERYALAIAKDCHDAILVYPAPLPTPLNAWIGDIRVRSLGFVLAGDLAESGRRFLAALLAIIDRSNKVGAEERGVKACSPDRPPHPALAFSATRDLYTAPGAEGLLGGSAGH